MWSLLAALGLASAAPTTDADRLTALHGLVAEASKTTPKVPEISATSLKDTLGDVVVVDVREPHERAVSVLPGARSVG